MKVMITGDEGWGDVCGPHSFRVERVLGSLYDLCWALNTSLYLTHLDQPAGVDRIVDSWALRRLDGTPRIYLTPGFDFDTPVMLGSEFDLTVVFFGPGASQHQGTPAGRAVYRAAKAGAPVKMVLWDETEEE